MYSYIIEYNGDNIQNQTEEKSMKKQARRGYAWTLIVSALLVVFMLCMSSGTVLAGSAEESGDGAAPRLEIKYKNFSYSDSTYVLFAVNCENFSASEHPVKMLFWEEPQITGGYLKDTEKYEAESKGTNKIGGVPHEIFYSDGIAPKNLIDRIYCRAYTEIDGVTYYSEPVKYSPILFLRNMALSPTQSEVNVNIANALLNYAACAQIKFDHQTDDLATDTHYYIELENAVLDDGFAYGLYKENEVLHLKAQIPEGESFAKWLDDEDNVLGTEPEIDITLDRDMTVRAVVSSDPAYCDHDFGEWIEAADATCTEDGVVGHYHCDLCEHDFDADHALISGPVVIPALGHDLVHVDAKPATCVDGWTAYDYCTRCDYTEGYELLPAIDPHSYEETVVEPAGEARGYTHHVCSVCGDEYNSDFDYSLYSGVDFTTAGKFAIPYNFDSSVYTIEASVQLDPDYSQRAGVILGNYDGKNPGFNLEIYTNGHPRLFFMTDKDTKYDYVFDTDIRGEDVVNIAITLERGVAKLYIDGQLAETKELADFAMPQIKRTLVLGGDNRTGNSQSFKGTVYSASVFRDIRTEEEINADLILANADDPNCCVSYNLLDAGSLIGSTELDEILDYAQVTNAEELVYHAGHGTRSIEVMNDIVLDRTVYVISDVTLFSNSDVSIIRDPDFFSDMFVIGENSAGRNLILDGIICKLDLGKPEAEGTLTIDGNKENVTDDVFGSIVYINNSGTLNIHENAVLANNKKVSNARSLGMQQYYGSMVGGAAIVNINGVVTMDGGVIRDNETNFDDPGAGDTTNELYLQSCYGGAIFNNSNFTMTGGMITGNSGYYGGAIANFQECKILGGVFDGNFTSHAGGAIYVYNSEGRVLTVGSENGDPDDVIFRNNYTTVSSGGAIYSGAKCYTLIYGGCTFDSNTTPGNGGAVYLANCGEIGPGAVFTNNHAGTGGAVYITASASDRRTTKLTGVTFDGNTAKYGAAAAIVGGDTTVTDCVAINNSVTVHGAAYYINRLSDNTGADVVMTGGRIENNTSGGEAGALFADLNCTVSISGTQMKDNSSVGNGGAISLHGVKKLELTNVTFTGNSTSTTTPEEGAGVSGNGGALYASYRTVTDDTDPENPVTTRVASTVTAKDCTFENNHSDGSGGALMAIDYDNATTVIKATGCTFTGNTANSHGGAAHISATTAEFTDCGFSGNTSNANGGAVYNNSRATLISNGCSFENNRSENTQYGGGAIYFTNSTGKFNDAVFKENGSNVNGGAIAAYTTSTVELTDVTAEGNSANANGGFLYAFNSAVTVKASQGKRSVIGGADNGNTATGGGGIYCDTHATLNISDTDLTYNATKGSGGALYFVEATGTVNNCVMSHNDSGINGADSYGGAILAGYGSNVTITDSEISDNTATAWAGGMYIRHKSETLGTTVTAIRTTFGNNSATASTAESGKGGAVLVREYCTFNADNCTFDGNSASGYGGAIYIDTNGTADVSDSTFNGNSTGSGDGGAIYANKNVILDITGTEFTGNTSSGTGGAVYANTNATLTVDGSLFDGNTSVGIGGAYYSNSAAATMTDTDFTNNSTTGTSAWYGGAIYTNGTSRLTMTECEFRGNNNTHGTGGAICVRGTGSLELDGCLFEENYTAGVGGAVHVFGITATIKNTTFNNNRSNTTGGALQIGKDENDNSSATVTDCTFSGNNAVGGGAIYVKKGASADITGTALTANTAGSTGGGAVYTEAGTTLNISDSTLSKNTVPGSGGAIYAKESAVCTIDNTVITENTAGYGGAMIIYGADVRLAGGEISGNSGTSGQGGAIYLRQGGNGEQGLLDADGTIFGSNVCAGGSGGGAVYVNTNSHFTAENATFDGNSAVGGGAVFVNSSTSSFEAVNCIFNENTATGQGGAVYSNSSNTNFNGCTFTGNSGMGDGSYYAGAVYMNGTSVSVIDDCVFNDNHIEKYAGGAICARGTVSLTINGSEFNGNRSKAAGGAIYIFETANAVITDTEFNGNASTNNTGGAIQLGRSDNSDAATLTLNGCTFTSNSATNGGALALYGKVSLTAVDTDFISNSATNLGGAVYLYLDGTDATFTNCRFEGNTSTGNGGAIYHSCATNMTWTNVTVKNNESGAKGDAVYVTNGSGKNTHFTINSATFDQNGGDPINIGNTGAYVTVTAAGVTDVNNDPVDFSLLIIGTLTNVTYV